MWKEAQRKNEQDNLAEDLRKLKRQLEEEKRRNADLEKQLSMFRKERTDSSGKRNFGSLISNDSELSKNSTHPIMLWEEDFSPAFDFISDLNRRGMTDLRHYFKSKPDELVDLLKKIEVTPLNHASQNLANAKEASNLFELIDPNSYDQIIDFFYAIQQKQYFLNSQTSFQTKNGETQFFAAQLTVARGFEHNYSRVIVAVTNVTESRLIELELQETNRQLTTLVGNLKGIIYRCLYDQNWTMLFASDSIKEMTGYTANEFIQRKQISFVQLMHPDDLERVSKTIQTAIASDQRFTAEYRIRTKSGDERWFWEQGTGVKNTSGKVETLEGYILDITEQKNARIKLDNERLHLRTVIETIPDLIWLKDINGNYLTCNPRFEQLFGAKEAEIIGKTDYDFVDKELADFFRKNDLTAMHTNQPTTNLEWVTFASDGRRALLETIKTPMRDSYDKLIGVLGIARDITVTKQHEEELKESKNWYEAIFNNTGTATCIVNEDSEIILMNDMFVQLTGYTETDMTNKAKWIDFVLPEDMKRMQQYHRERREAGKNPPKQYECKLINKQGQQHHILLNIDLIPGTTMSVASLLDISLRVNALDELKQSQEKYQNLVENVNDVIYELDRNWTVTYISPTVEAVTGYPAESYLGKHFMEVIAPEDHSIMQEVHQKFVETKKIAPFTFRVKTKDKSLVWIRISARPVLKDGQLIGSRGVAVNVTQHKITENELIQAKEDAEQANHLKSAFLATMSHELRTPLNTIIGFSKLMDHTVPKEEMIDMAGIIYNSGNHLLSIIESIFNLTLLQSRQVKLKTETFSLRDLQKNLQFYLGSELSKYKKAQLTTHFQHLDDRQEIDLTTDKTKLTQLLTNLLGNAVKYSDKGVIQYSYQIEDQDILFCVKDEGMGIPPGKQDIIFEHFRQIDDTNTRKHGGVGLGLAICKEIAELVNGDIWVESEHNQGSSFYFRLPGVVKVRKMR